MGKWNRLTDVKEEGGRRNRKKLTRNTDNKLGKAWEGGGRVKGGKEQQMGISVIVNNF